MGRSRPRACLRTFLVGGATCIAFATVQTNAHAQSSASHTLEEFSINSGGRPDGGTVVNSASHQLTLGSVGGGARALGIVGGRYELDGGFVPIYRPPTNVTGLFFKSKDILRWSPDPSVGAYNVYRGDIDALDGTNYGDCEVQAISRTNFTDEALPSRGDGFFYLITAENRLHEEGTLGDRSDGTERPLNAPCP